MKTFKVKEKDFETIKWVFQGYVFNRKDETGCYVKLDRGQEDYIRTLGKDINLIEVGS